MLKVFLCHSSRDKGTVRDLYQRLTDDGVAVWLAEFNVLPGQDWKREIRAAVRSTEVVIVCLSRSSITEAGYAHKEISLALDIAGNQPEGTIFLIPLRFDDTEIPDRLRPWQALNRTHDNWYDLLLQALEERARSLGSPWRRPAPGDP